MALISRENGWLRNAFGVAVAIVLVPLAISTKLIATPFERRAKRRPSYVAVRLRKFLANEPDADRFWDEFTSVPLADPVLESIRNAAVSVELPLDDAGRAKLEALLAQAEALAADDLSPPTSERGR